MNVDLPEISTIEVRLSGIEKNLEVLVSDKTFQQEWYSLRSACALKGVNYNTVRSKPVYQPNLGVPDARQGQARYWRRETVVKWTKEF